MEFLPTSTASFYLDLPNDDSERFILYPIKHPRIWELYKLHQSIEWRTEEIKLHNDVQHFAYELNEDERTFIKHVLAFFVAGDVVVGEMLSHHMMNLPMYEAQFFYNYQLQVENIHFETYSLMVYTLIDDETERRKIYTAAVNDDVMRRKINWVEEYVNRSDVTFGERLLALAVVEGLFFSGAFAAIFWLKDRGIMPGLTFANELISRDEFLHCVFACTLLNEHVKHKPSEETIHRIVRSAVEVETAFYRMALVKKLRKMNEKKMIRYIQYLADRLCVDLKARPIYSVSNPFPDILSISSLCGKTNFFERTVSEYEKADMGGGIGRSCGDGKEATLPSMELRLDDSIRY